MKWDVAAMINGFLAGLTRSRRTALSAANMAMAVAKVAEHTSAYPEYVISALAAPQGMSPDTVGSGNLARAPESSGMRSGAFVGSADLVGSK
jgi:hypothetical protein